MPLARKKLPQLSWEFTEDMRKDAVKVYLLPAKYLLQSILCWPDDETSHGKLLGWSLFCIFFLTEIFHATYVLIHIKDVSDAVGTSITVTTTLEGLIRLHIMLTKRDTINAILVKIWKQFWSVDLVDERTKKELKRKALISVVLTATFFACGIPANTMITVVPFLKHNQLILKSSFPFGWNGNFVYEGLYVFQYFVDWYVLFVINAFDVFFVSTVTTCTTQFAILQHVVRCIVGEEAKEDRMKIFEELGWYMTDKKMLHWCLEQHKLLNSICSDMESSFNIAILIQFAVSISANCGAFLIIKVDYDQFFKMFFFALGHLIQLFYYCYAGQEISYQASSEQTADAIYECGWHLKYDREFRKSLALMLQRSQRTQYLTAAGLTPLDYASFIKILRLTFSFYTLLDKFLEKEVE